MKNFKDSVSKVVIKEEEVIARLNMQYLIIN